MGHRGKTATAIQDFLATALDISFKASAVAFAALLIYTFINLIQGGFTPSRMVIESDPARLDRAVNVARTLSRLLIFVSAFFAISTVVRLFEFQQIGVFLILGGAASYVGVPLLMSHLLEERMNDAVKALEDAFHIIGVILIGTGIIRSVIAVIQRIIEGPPVEIKTQRSGKLVVKAREVKKKMRYYAWSPCWKLPYCSDSMARICPVFHQKKTCWRVGRGCQCDPILIETLVGGMAVVAADQSSGDASALKSLDQAEAVRRRWRSTNIPKRKAPCDRCAIFMLHQQMKHQILSPLPFLAIPAIFWLGWPIYDTIYTGLITYINSLWSSIALSPSAQGDPSGLLNIHAKIFLAVIIGFYLVVYFTRFVEYCLFKLRL